jgi:hypothetical protein
MIQASKVTRLEFPELIAQSVTHVASDAQVLDETRVSLTLAYMGTCRARVDDGQMCSRDATRLTGLCGRCHVITVRSAQCMQPISKKRPFGKHCGRRHKAAPERRRRAVRNIIKTVIAVTITFGAVTIAINETIGGSSGTRVRSFSVQVTVDLKESLGQLATAGWMLSTNSPSNLGPRYYSDCAKSATGNVQLFLSPNRCKQYATAIRAVTKNGVTSLVAISWVEMRTTGWANQYKTLVGEYGTGNPPGVSPLDFNGHCYASGPSEPGRTVWTVQVQLTGDITIDRKVLQAAALRNLSPRYLQQHCRSR